MQPNLQTHLICPVKEQMLLINKPNSPSMRQIFGYFNGKLVVHSGHYGDSTEEPCHSIRVNVSGDSTVIYLLLHRYFL